MENKGPAFLTVALLFTVLAALTVLLRVYVRVWIKRAFGWDDGIIILSTVYDRLHRGIIFRKLTRSQGPRHYWDSIQRPPSSRRLWAAHATSQPTAASRDAQVELAGDSVPSPQSSGKQDFNQPFLASSAKANSRQAPTMVLVYHCCSDHCCCGACCRILCWPMPSGEKALG